MQKKTIERNLLLARYRFLDQVLHDRLSKNLIAPGGKNGIADKNPENEKQRKPYGQGNYPDLK